MGRTAASVQRSKRVLVSVDVALLTLHEGRLSVGLVPRASAPFKAKLALPGGEDGIEQDRDLDATVARVLSEQAGLTDIYAEQLRTFAAHDRDPRGWSASITYLALLPLDRVDDVAKSVVFRPADDPGVLAFDHATIVAAARERLRTKGAYSTLPARLLPASFTLPEMQQVYEAVIGERLDQSSFRRKIAELGAVEMLAGHTRQTATVRRPAQLYTLAAPIALFEKRI